MKYSDGEVLELGDIVEFGKIYRGFYEPVQGEIIDFNKTTVRVSHHHPVNNKQVVTKVKLNEIEFIRRTS